MELLYDDDDLLWSLIGYETHKHVLGMMKKPMEPLMNILIPLQISWIPLLALDMVRWHDDVVFGDLMKSWNLDAHCLHLMWLRHPHTYWLDEGPFHDKIDSMMDKDDFKEPYLFKSV